MTPKEKAFELAHKFRLLEIRTSENSYMMISMQAAKQCALIALEEIIKAIPDASDDDSPYNHELVWWQEVEKEIEAL